MARFLLLIGCIGFGFAAGTALTHEEWPKFWAYFAVWCVSLIVLYVTRPKEDS